MKKPLYTAMNPLKSDAIGLLAVGIPKSHGNPGDTLDVRLYRISDMRQFDRFEASIDLANNILVCDQGFRKGLELYQDL